MYSQSITNLNDYMNVKEKTVIYHGHFLLSKDSKDDPEHYYFDRS